MKAEGRGQKAEVRSLRRIALLLSSAFCLLPSAFISAQPWTAHPADGVEMHLSREGEINRLDFDFHGHGGYAIARRDVELELPANYQFTFRIRGDAPIETLEFKLIRGDDVWWMNRRDFAFPREWSTVVTKKRQVSFAWGPSGGGEAKHINALEVVVTAGSGGKGTVWFTDPVLEELPLVTNEIGGLIVECDRCSVPGALQERVGKQLFVWLPETPTQIPHVDGKVTPMPVDWAPTTNDFYSIVAKHETRGAYPRNFLGEQSYWTVIGADGAENEALVGEDGAVEPFKSGESIEPFLIIDGKRLTRADGGITETLAEGDLPIPSVTWKTKNASMTMTAAVSSSSMLQLRYRVRGNASLELKKRPFQVNPSTQFLTRKAASRRCFIRSCAFRSARTDAKSTSRCKRERSASRSKKSRTTGARSCIASRSTLEARRRSLTRSARTSRTRSSIATVPRCSRARARTHARGFATARSFLRCCSASGP